MKLKRSLLLFGLLIAVGTVQWVANAGDLEPPGSPAPTMKTLEAVEPRIAIDQDCALGAGCAPGDTSGFPVEIMNPGSYFLSSDLVVPDDGIVISADNVTLDLEGFSITSGTGSGIAASGSPTNLTVRNGFVGGFGNNGVSLATASNVSVTGVVASGNGSTGIAVGLYSVVRDSVAQNNATGIAASGGSTIEGCTAASNASDGIVAGGGATVVRACAATLNGNDGISANASALVVDCAVTSNTRNGIRAGNGCTIRNNVSRGNTEDGIQVDFSNLVVGNHCHNNGFGAGLGAGIHVINAGNRIDNNSVTSTDIGIDVDAAGNLIVRNSARGNGTEYSIVGGNDVGPIGSGAASTSPWANLDY